METKNTMGNITIDLIDLLTLLAAFFMGTSSLHPTQELLRHLGLEHPGILWFFSLIAAAGVSLSLTLITSESTRAFFALESKGQALRNLWRQEPITTSMILPYSICFGLVAFYLNTQAIPRDTNAMAVFGNVTGAIAAPFVATLIGISAIMARIQAQAKSAAAADPRSTVVIAAGAAASTASDINASVSAKGLGTLVTFADALERYILTAAALAEILQSLPPGAALGLGLVFAFPTPSFAGTFDGKETSRPSTVL